MADTTNLVLRQMLQELQKLNAFQQQEAVAARNITQVTQADSLTPVVPNLARGSNTSPGTLQAPGSISANASTPQQMDIDALEQSARRQNEVQASTTATASAAPNEQAEAEKAIAWTLLGEAGMGGPLGRISQARYTVGRYTDAAGKVQGALASQLNQIGGTPGTQYGDEGGYGINPSGTGLGNMVTAPLQQGIKFAGEHQLATTLGYMAVTGAMARGQTAMQEGLALGYGAEGNYGGPRGWADYIAQMGATREGLALSEIQKQLEYGVGLGGMRYDAALSGMRPADAQALVGAVAGAGFSATPAGLHTAQGNAATIAEGLAPAVQAMGQQGAAVAGDWLNSLRSANTSIQDLTGILSQIPAAAKNSQLGIQGFNQALLTIAGTLEGMGGTQIEAGRMGINFEAQNPGVTPADLSQLLKSPILQGFALSQGVLPSGIGAMMPSQQNALSAQTVNMLVEAMSPLAQKTQYETLPNGQRIPMNNGQAAVYQQVASMLGISPQDVKKMHEFAQNPQRQNAIGALQNAMGGDTLGQLSGLEAITGTNPRNWGRLSNRTRQSAEEFWNANMNPTVLAQAGLSQKQIRQLTSDPNITNRLKRLQTDLQGSGGTGAGQKGNASTVQVQVGLTQQAQKWLTVTTSQRGKAKIAQNAGGNPLNSILNTAEGQHPAYTGGGFSSGGFGASGNGGDPVIQRIEQMNPGG